MTRAERKQAHRELAAWLRENGVNPAGQAWELAKDGCRDIAALRSSNVADGCLPRRVADSGRYPSSLRHGDILTGSGTVTGDPVQDPDRGTVWVQVTRTDGTVADLELEASTPVEYTRPRHAPAWVQAAAADYRSARDAWEQARESGMVAPTSVPGIAGSAVSMSQLEDSDYAAACPRPEFRDFLRDHAARNREIA